MTASQVALLNQRRVEAFDRYQNTRRRKGATAAHDRLVQATHAALRAELAEARRTKARKGKGPRRAVDNDLFAQT